MKPLLLILSLFLVACNTLKEGKVMSKGIEPERDYLYMMPIPHTISSGKTSSTFYTYIPIWMHDDEDYYVNIKGVNNANEEVEETFYISKPRYECLKGGDFFKVDDDCSAIANADTQK
jgi:hypothetical protein